DRGDLSIRLVRAEHSPPLPLKLPAIPIPHAGTPLHPVVEELSSREDLLQVSRESRPRAVRILQAIAAEADRRGHALGLRADGKPGFCLSIGEDAYDFVVQEEYDAVEVFADEQVAAKKYSWQRVSGEVTWVASGRLAITTDERWARQQRW